MLHQRRIGVDHRWRDVLVILGHGLFKGLYVLVGGGLFNVTMRSGTNQYHGALFWANNNSALNANDWFNNLKHAPKSYLKSLPSDETHGNVQSIRLAYARNCSSGAIDSVTSVTP